MLPLSADPALEASYEEWSASRVKFNADMKVQGSDARKAGWQKHYQQGTGLHGNEKPFPHLTKTNLRPFERMK